MKDDLVEQLRAWASTPDEGVQWAARARYLMAEAAGTIGRMAGESLRAAELRERRNTIDQAAIES